MSDPNNEVLCVTAFVDPETGGLVVRKEDQFLLCEVLRADGKYK